MKRLVSAFLIAGSVVVAGAGYANAQSEVSGEPRFSLTISGFDRAPSQEHMLNSALPGQNNISMNPLFAIESNERRDNPCFMRTEYQRANGSRQGLSAGIYDTCNRLGDQGEIRVAAANNRYITGVRVCQRGGSGRRADLLKGIRIRQARFVNGNLNNAGTREAERTNCGRWAPWSSCPSSMTNGVVTDILLHVEPSRFSYPAIVGLQVICRELS